MVSSTVSGTPVATPDAEPKDLVMSLRTMPDSVSTFGPLEPSPGYGPAVSCGISSTSVPVVVLEVALGLLVVVGVLDVVVVPVVVESVVPVVSVEHPATAARPAPANRPRKRRRWRVRRSYCRPRSCSRGGFGGGVMGTAWQPGPMVCRKPAVSLLGTVFPQARGGRTRSVGGLA
jgi:hypothetical protein